MLPVGSNRPALHLSLLDVRDRPQAHPEALVTSREKFEAWAVTEHMAVHRNGGEQYINTPTQHAWLGWQACALAQAEAPDIDVLLAAHGCHLDQKTSRHCDYCVEIDNRMRAALAQKGEGVSDVNIARERRAFERWCKSEGYSTIATGGLLLVAGKKYASQFDYQESHTEIAWRSWLARATRVKP